ncbi:MAG TPA: thioredoxin domain-containing protein [Terriglobales bacterium]|nr:thioredoxin domain-containing protein [Terriglobales bacterium]
MFILLLICLGCSAQSAPPDTVQKIERQVRFYYTIPPEVKVAVGPLRSSDFPNYNALTITFDNGKKKDYEFLLSKDGNTLVRLTRMDLNKDPYVEIMNKIDVSGRPIRGNKNAKVTVVNYDDFECPFCSRMHQTLFPELLKEYGDRVQFIYKDYPLTEIHPWATRAAVNATCLADQNGEAYWDFADYIHGNQGEVNKEKQKDAQFSALDKITMIEAQKHNLDLAKLQSCIKAQDEKSVRASMREGDELGVSATPTLFINGEKIDGAVPPDQLRDVLDRALKQAGVAAPAHSAPVPAPSTTK